MNTGPTFGWLLSQMKVARARKLSGAPMHPRRKRKR